MAVDGDLAGGRGGGGVRHGGHGGHDDGTVWRGEERRGEDGAERGEEKAETQS